MTYLITFLENNEKYAVYTGVNNHGIYRYLYIIRAPTILTTSGQSSHNFGTYYSIKNDTVNLHSIVVDLHMWLKIICKCCGSILHYSDACIIRGPKLLQPIIRRDMNQYKSLHGDETTHPTIECNNQPPVAHLKSIVSSIMWILNHHKNDNGDA